MGQTSQPATDERIAVLADHLQWSDAAHGRAIDLAERSPSASQWADFLQRSALALGTVLVLAGIVDLVAFNWQDLGRFSRIFLVAGLFVAASLAALIRGPVDLRGRLATASAAFLIGPLIGVIGQTYQTGADAWQLFAYWTALSLPFLAASRWVPLLLMWTVLVDITLCTLHAQTYPGTVATGFAYTATGIALLHVGVVVAAERLGLAPWFGRTQALGAGLFAVIAVTVVGFFEQAAAVWIASAVALAAMVPVQFRYRDAARDPFAVAVSLLVVLVALNAPVLRFLVDQNWDAWELQMIGMGLLILVESGAALAWLSGYVRRAREQA